MAVDGGDDRLLAAENGERKQAAEVAHSLLDLRVAQALAHVLDVGLERLVQAEDVALAGQVHAGAEGPAGAGDDDGADRVVIAGAIEGLDQFTAHLHRKGVELVGPIQREAENRIFHFIDDGLVRHGCFSSTPVAAA